VTVTGCVDACPWTGVTGNPVSNVPIKAAASNFAILRAPIVILLVRVANLANQ
jgi:hypothetical protein